MARGLIFSGGFAPGREFPSLIPTRITEYTHDSDDAKPRLTNNRQTNKHGCDPAEAEMNNSLALKPET